MAVSAAQAQVTNAQAKARMTWTPGYSNLVQTAELMASDVPVGNGADAMARLWIEVLTGSLSLTPTAPSAHTELWFEYKPEDD